jgi:uncharacterized protein
MLRLLEEFLWSLRRKGVKISPAQAIDAARAALLVGFDQRETLRDALAAVVVTQSRDRVVFEAMFERFFALEGRHDRDLPGRLRAQGFDEGTVARVREILEALAGSEGPDGEDERLLVALFRGSMLDHRLTSAEVERAMSGLSGPLQVGFFVQRLVGVLGVGGKALGRLRHALEGALGASLGAAVFGALAKEIELARGEIREFVEARVAGGERERPAVRGVGQAAFASLDAAQVDEVRRAIRVLGERLRGAARVRERHGRRGRLDAHRSLREAMKTGGVPIRPAFKARRRDRPRLWVLCDVSDSVRTASLFLLEFLAVAQELFERTRTFVFVSDLGETTSLFEGRPMELAMGEVFGGGVVNLAHNSNYGRVLRQLEERHGREIDRRSSIVILGDGRSNFQPPEVEALSRLRERARAVYWLCPEPRGSWGTGDSVMPRYAKASTRVLMASTAAELEAAARALLSLRLRRAAGFATKRSQCLHTTSSPRRWPGSKRAGRPSTTTRTPSSTSSSPAGASTC